MSMRHFIAQRILSIQLSERSESVPVKSSEALINVVEESKQLYSRFGAACLQVINTKEKHSRKL